MHRAKTNRWIIAIFILICVALCLLLWLFGRNKIVGTIHGAEMNQIIVDNVTYVISNTGVYNGTQKGSYIGKGAWPNGEAVLDLYRLKGDTDFYYLYARFGWEGEMYQREDMINE